ncbi:MAG: IS200/IS605 family transposase [Arcicella sp.]|nr:IS200/IS605 family transposase [Arcicella sp.]
MPYTRVWIHFVWSTKNRKPVLVDSIRQKVFQHIKSNAAEKGIYLDSVNGYIEHVHCLVSLGTEQTIAKVMQLIKGESAFWVNKQNLIKDKLEWQDEYFAVSVSESNIEAVRNYIWNQEEHHKKKTYTEEYNEFISKYKFQKFG